MSTQKLIEKLQKWHEHYSDPADKNNYDFFTALIAAVERLEAAERERDELSNRLTIVREQRDAELNKNTVLEAEIARRDAAAGEPVAFTHESEISNMHATGLYIRGFPADRRLNAEEGYTVALYTAAPPAVLPELEQDVKNIIGLLSENEWAEHCTKSELGRKLEGEITRLHDLRAAPAPGGG